VDLLRDEKLRVQFTECFKDFLETLDLVLPRPEAIPYVQDAKQLGLIRKSVADLYRDEKLNLVDAREKVRALIDQYIQSQGIDPKVEPIDVLSLDFKAHVQRHRSTKAQAAEMEYAARHHISVQIEEDPVYYQKLSERLDQILQTFADNWEAQVEALRQYIEDIKKGRPADQTGLEPKTQLPFLSLIAEESERDLSELAQATVEIVDRIRTVIRRVRFWENLVAQEELKNWIVQYLDDNDVVSFERQESVADKLVQLARHKHETLMT
jgi:type I restriction enzyme R subunit